MPGCSSALSILKRLSELENNKTEFYVYQVLVLLSQLWLAFCKNLDPPKEKVDVVLNTRMQKFLQYISEHYSEDISLDMLSKSAGVSKSECLRCFKISMQTTPYHYLLEFRLAKAAELLKNSSKPICEISEQVGFHQQSYFGKCFRQKTGNSPREYRKKMNETR